MHSLDPAPSSTRVGDAPLCTPRGLRLAYTALSPPAERRGDNDLRRAILLSVAWLPLLVALWAAADPRPRRGLRRLLAGLLLFEIGYGLFLFYIFLRLPD